jgi:hypothetical protein
MATRKTNPKAHSFPGKVWVLVDQNSLELAAYDGTNPDMDAFEHGEWVGEYELKDIKRVKKTVTLEKA